MGSTSVLFCCLAHSYCLRPCLACWGAVQVTVFESLLFSARLRLPRDVGMEVTTVRVQEALQDSVHSRPVTAALPPHVTALPHVTAYQSLCSSPKTWMHGSTIMASTDVAVLTCCPSISASVFLTRSLSLTPPFLPSQAFVDEVMELVELSPLRNSLVGMPGVSPDSEHV